MQVSIRLKGSDSIRRILDKIHHEMGNPIAANRKTAAYGTSITLKHIKEEKDSDGVKWKPLSPVTIKRRKGAKIRAKKLAAEARKKKGKKEKKEKTRKKKSSESGGVSGGKSSKGSGSPKGPSTLKMLVETGDMKRSISSWYTGDQVGFGTNDPKAPKHQFGGKEYNRMKAGLGKANPNLPKREFLFVTHTEGEVILNIYAEALKKAAKEPGAIGGWQ